jgi:hypothetical protein
MEPDASDGHACEICGREFNSAAEHDRHVREMGLVV